jgi:hypothetical protein
MLRIDGKFFDVTDRAGEECHRITVFLLWMVMLAARLGLERPSGLYGNVTTNRHPPGVDSSASEPNRAVRRSIWQSAAPGRRLIVG